LQRALRRNDADGFVEEIHSGCRSATLKSTMASRRTL
jgi:hypothetical protein